MRAEGEREAPAAELSLTELLAALSLAGDLGNGLPLERTMRTAVIAVETGRALGIAEASLADALYLALLRAIGCTAFAHEEAAAYGDDIVYRNAYFPVDFSREEEVIAATRDHLAEGQPAALRRRAVERFFASGERLVAEMAEVACSVAVRFADRLEMSAAVGDGLTQIWERWDGGGFPRGLAGEEIEVAARLLHLANVAEISHRVGGRDDARERIGSCSGGWLDPAACEAFASCSESLLGTLEGDSAWDALRSLEPAPRLRLPDPRFDEVAAAFADFADLKSPFLLGHSSGVARLAEAAGEAHGLGHEECRRLRRAGFLHDLGRVGVSSAIWAKAGPLDFGEWERVRLHAYYSERILSQTASLEPLASLVGSHHERLDGSGYHRGCGPAQLPPEARVLAAADVFQALTEPRPQRPALSSARAAETLVAEVAGGRLDREAVAAVLEAAGERARLPKPSWPAGLTDREVEVLRLLARGSSKREIAAALVISPATVHTHVTHIYEKTGASRRASVALFAIENDLLSVG